uniref:CARD domain-containing protein n=1 Tax=Callorhinchus milii TaxID=7868 RepID=A0A4W3JZ00_CALMI
MREISPKVFESFVDQVSLVGPVFDVHTQTKGTKVMVFLPTYTPCETELSPSVLAESLLTLLTMKYQDVGNCLCKKLEAVLSAEEKSRLFKVLLQEDCEAAVKLILSKGQRALQLLCEYLRASGSEMRSWPAKLRSLLETSPTQVGHIQDGNLELVVPLAVLERHLLLFTESLSPLAVIEKLRRLFTQTRAYCLLYKPVGRQYIDCRVTLRVFLIPRSGSLVQGLDTKLKGYKRVFISNISIKGNVCYRLLFKDVTSDNSLLRVTPRDGSEYKEALSLMDPMTKYLIALNIKDWVQWPLVLQITRDKNSVIFEETIDDEMLQFENGEYFILNLDGKKHCIMRIHQEISYKEFSHKLNTVLPERKLSVYYKQDGIPLLVNNDESIKMILRDQCGKDIVLEAEDIIDEVITAGMQVMPLARLPSPNEPLSRRRPSPTEQHFVVRHRTALIKRISDIKSLLDDLRHESVINDNEYQRIRGENIRNEQITHTVDYTINKGKNAMDIFYESLSKNDPHLVEDLQLREIS